MQATDPLNYSALSECTAVSLGPKIDLNDAASRFFPLFSYFHRLSRMSPKPASIDEKEQEAQLENRDSESASYVSPPYKLTEEQEAKLWKKIDRRLMPILCLMYLMSFLDRGEP